MACRISRHVDDFVTSLYFAVFSRAASLGGCTLGRRKSILYPYEDVADGMCKRPSVERSTANEAPRRECCGGAKKQT